MFKILKANTWGNRKLLIQNRFACRISSPPGLGSNLRSGLDSWLCSGAWYGTWYGSRFGAWFGSSPGVWSGTWPGTLQHHSFKPQTIRAKIHPPFFKEVGLISHKAKLSFSHMQLLPATHAHKEQKNVNAKQEEHCHHQRGWFFKIYKTRRFNCFFTHIIIFASYI